MAAVTEMQLVLVSTYSSQVTAVCGGNPKYHHTLRSYLLLSSVMSGYIKGGCLKESFDAVVCPAASFPCHSLQ